MPRKTLMNTENVAASAPVHQLVGQRPASRESSTDWEHDGDLAFILDYLIECAKGWEPKARLLGNARAEDIIRAIVMVKNKAAWCALRVNRLQHAQQFMRDPERKMVCDIIANGSTELPNAASSPNKVRPATVTLTKLP